MGSGSVGIPSAGDGNGGNALPPSHWPNRGFGDAGCGLSEAGFSPLTSSSSPPNTGVFARGELRSGRVLGLPKLAAEAGDGVSEDEGEGSVGVGCWRGVCNDRDSFDGDPGGVVVRNCSGGEAFDDGSVDCTLIEGRSAFGVLKGVLEGERDSGSGTFVGSSSSSLGGTSSSASPVPSCSSSPPRSSSPSSPSLASCLSSSPSSSSN